MFGSAGFGFTMAGELEQRMSELGQIRQLMLRLRSELCYMHRPLPDAFFEMSKEIGQPFADFFRKTAEELEDRKGSTASEIWRMNADALLDSLHIAKSDRQEFRKLGSMLGGMDMEMQLGMLDYYLQRLELSERHAADTIRTHKRLYQYLGVLSGALLVILLI